ncbi:ABC transporter permease [Bifidobacterium crudilactis]|uniref:ABC transporter permease n=1 Tax=Bifidobacterium crudilactis TaxID=327277 RepID=A0A971CYZ4_9BIFI|nr:ABC transporter permease [Bifidobacterium crudilactis]MDN5972404.1 ABC transporter permease [Bifidobacterium crudilactis]MDN6000445.1 ABC transporter permease [Bifidobacterium crudilactis]MDN6209963.1 ABC transporter permease [Bifidobacterium crudilactis]MDN6234042.1 ABC transporter permease [Bifidobacterium crudilactis]MDN6272191.1 ABC transporter permease [Bifidobacterium crudilactis]
MWSSAYAWLTDPANWAGPESIPVRLAQHLGITLVAVLIAALIALPLGVVVGHVRRGTGFIGALTGAARAVPTLGLLTIVGLWIGIGITAPLVALVVLAIPSLLAGAYAGMQAVDPSIPEGAKAIGMSPLQVVFRVEIPLASPTIVGGIRAATLQVVATATLAAYTSDVGLGRFLFAGLKTRDYPMMLAAALLVVVVTVLLEVVLAAIQRAVTRRYASA